MSNCVRVFVVLAVVFCLSVLAQSTQAAVYTYFGEDLNTGETTRLLSHPNADAARASFLSNLVGVGTEDFEGIAAGTTVPLNISFAGSSGAITATLSGAGEIQNIPGTGTWAGRYPISGDQLLGQVVAGSSVNALTIDFSSPISAFGFYGTDFGDFNGITELYLTNGATVTQSIGNSTNIAGAATLYFGIIDTTHSFDKIVFRNTNPSGGDYFGFDDMTIGDYNQVVPNPTPQGGVPEPGTFVIWTVLGAVGFTVGWRRKRKEA